MLGTPRIHVHPMIIFLRGSLFLVPILSFPRRSVTFSLSNTKQARWEQKHRDGPPGIYRVSTFLHWYQIASHPLVPFISAS